jgi:peptidoglycan-N-acetylglucosamine deacetylase
MGDDIPYALREGTPRFLNFPPTGRSTISLTTPTTAISVIECLSPRRNGQWKSSAANSTRLGNLAPMDLGLAPGIVGRLARFKAVLEPLDYMRAKGGVWFARLDQVCDHVQRLMTEGRWTPRCETSRSTKARSPNSPKNGAN